MSSPALMTGLGSAMAIFLSAAGSSYATAYSGAYALRSNLKSEINALFSFFPVIISGVLSIYGTIIAYLLYTKLGYSEISVDDGYRYFASGLTVGLGTLASGLGMGKYMQWTLIDDTASSLKDGSRMSEESPLIPVTIPNSFTKGGFYRIVFVLIFIEAIGLYSLCIALFISYN